MKNRSEILLQNQVHQLNKGQCIVYDGTIDGEPCYCMVDYKNTEKIIFDKSDSVLDGIKRIKRYSRENISKVVTDDGISTFRGYVFRIYFGSDIWQEVHRTYLKDNHLMPDGVLDWRRHNIGYYSKKDFDLSVLQRPNEPDEKYIALTYDGVTEIFDNINKVHNYLTGGGLSLSVRDGRLKTGKGNLAREVYEQIHGDFAEGYDCAHIHSGYRWLNSVYNLMPMKGSTNDSMSDLASQIGGGVKMNAIVFDAPCGSHKILVEYRLMNLRPVYLVCDTPELYLDLQKQIMGKTKLTQNLKLFWNGEKVNTPKEEYSQTKKKENHLGDKVCHLWEWCDARDRILSVYTNAPESFIPWTGVFNDLFEIMISRMWIKAASEQLAK